VIARPRGTHWLAHTRAGARSSVGAGGGHRDDARRPAPARVLLSGLTASVDDDQAGRDAQREFAEGFTSAVAEAVPPGGAVFIAVIDDRWVTEIGRGLRGYHRLTRRRV